MGNLSTWSQSAGGNTSSSPNGAPESMPPSGVNDTMREMMAATRRWYEDAEWIDRGNTPTFLTTASFSLAGDHRTPYHTGRRIKCSDASVLYGKISDVTYSANTRVSVTLDSGQLSSSLTAVAVGILSFNNKSLPDLSASYAISAGYATSASYAASAGSALSAESIDAVKVAIGIINADGTINKSDGNITFTSSKITTGQYRIDHANFVGGNWPVLTATPYNTAAFRATVASISQTISDIYTFDVSATAADTVFTFILMGTIS